MTPTQPKRCQPARSRRTVSPGLQGKAGSRGRRDGLPLISGGGVGGKAPDPSSTDSERWRLFRFLFGRSKRNIAPGDERSKANDFQPEKQKETRFSHSNIACSAMENRGTAISGPSAAAWGGGWPPKRRLRAPVAPRSGRCRRCAWRRRLAMMIARGRQALGRMPINYSLWPPKSDKKMSAALRQHSAWRKSPAKAGLFRMYKI